jgi:hypothetical protein
LHQLQWLTPLWLSWPNRCNDCLTVATNLSNFLSILVYLYIYIYLFSSSNLMISNLQNPNHHSLYTQNPLFYCSRVKDYFAKTLRKWEMLVSVCPFVRLVSSHHVCSFWPITALLLGIRGWEVCSCKDLLVIMTRRNRLLVIVDPEDIASL